MSFFPDGAAAPLWRSARATPYATAEGGFVAMVEQCVTEPGALARRATRLEGACLRVREDLRGAADELRAAANAVQRLEALQQEADPVRSAELTAARTAVERCAAALARSARVVSGVDVTATMRAAGQ